MIETVTCPRCGLSISPNSPGGLCPGCLFREALESARSADVPLAFEVNDEFVPPSPEELGVHFPGFELLKFIGRGGMGLVYQARQPQLQRIVALKILLPKIAADPAFAERFAREARMMALLNHPHVVSVYDFGQTQPKSLATDSSSRLWSSSPLYYFVMEYVDGLTLRQLLDAGKMSPQEAFGIVPQICEALQFAHDKGIVHRDIKPENILIDRAGQVKIADFGLAKLTGLRAEELTISRTGQVLGTLHYMSPEQVERPLEVDHRADIYSLGVVFYQMLTGELPLGRFAPPSSKAQLDVRLDEVVLRALEKEPERRYQQVSALNTQVQAIAASPSGIASTPTQKFTRVRRFGHFVGRCWHSSIWCRLGILLACVIALFLLLIAYFVTGRMLSHRSMVQLEDAPDELRQVSTSRVIEAGLRKPNSPWPWIELERRKLVSSDAERIVQGLTQWLKQANSQRQPLPFIRDQLFQKMDDESLVQLTTAVDFQEAFQGPLDFGDHQTPFRIREQIMRRTPVLDWSDCWSRSEKLFGMSMLNELRFVEVDGMAVALNEHPRNPVECHCWMNSLDLTRLSAGNHRLHVEVFTALVWSVDLKGHELLQGLKSSDWPKAVKSWTRTADLDIRVYGAYEQIVEPVTAPGLDPVSHGLTVKPIAVKSRAGKRELVVTFDAPNRLPVSIGFDVTLRIKNDLHQIGTYGIIELPVKEGFSRAGSNQPLIALLDHLDDDVTQVDLILKPNYSLNELDSRLNKIWGKEVTFKNVPLSRPNRQRERPDGR